MIPPKLNAQMQLGKLDLDRYDYFFISEANTSESTIEKGSSITDIIDSLKRLQGSGSVQIESLRYQQKDYQQIDIRFNDA